MLIRNLMDAFTQDSLLSAVNGDTKTVVLKSGDGSSVVICEYGGRPLGIFPKEDCVNLLWVNPEIKSTIKSNGHSIGGDRYWLSPERDFFYQDPENWKGWFCPPGLDPAKYEFLGRTEDSCTVSSPIGIKNMRTEEIYRGEITRQFTLVDEPMATGLNHAGLEFVDDCVIFKPKLRVNGWSLATILSGGKDNPGTVLIPTNKDPNPLSYFKEIPADRLIVKEDYVSYKIDVSEIYKLAIRPEDVKFDRKAKIGYVLDLPGSEKYGFLVKLSDDVPKTQDQCFDVARDCPEGEIGVIQSYNSESPDPSSLSFGEIELQLKSFETIDNTSHGKAVHQLFSYVGSKDEILGVIEKYLDISDPKLF